jgi:uncharacterized protein (TIGR03435 family)
MGDSLREWAPPVDEERVALDRVWTGLRWKANKVPADAVRSVELSSQVPEVPGVPRVLGVRDRRSMVRTAAAAALVIVAVGAAMLWPRGVRVYAAGNDGLQVTLADDSSVEMRAHSEMKVGRASDGIQIDLKTGDIIVTAARQRKGHLYVRTNDLTVAVEGTVFLANAGQQGSRVGVIEGEVRVRSRGTPLRRSGKPDREGSVETLVRPGEQLSTRPTIAQPPLAEDITWSRNKDAHLRVIDAFMKSVAQTTAPLTPLARQADVAGAQTPGAKTAALEFEEASVRPCDPDNLPAAAGGGRGGGGPNAVYMTPGRFYALCMTPATLIRTAYGYRSWNQEIEMWFMSDIVPGGRTFSLIGTGSVYNTGVEDGRRVRGGPDWMRTEAYTIEAVAGDMPADQDACGPASSGGRASQLPNQPRPPGLCYSANAASMSGPMLRALLERRFGLKAHIVTEQTPAYSLVVAPGGLKMKEGVCTNDAPRARGMDEATFARWMMDLVRRNLDAARRGDATTGLCGFGIADNGPNRVFVSAGAGMPPLQGILEAPVTDRTGIPNTRRFNYALEFLLDERTKTNPYGAIASPLLQIAADASSVQPAPNLFTAVEQQLGLRLEPSQVTREYIVIDAIRRPEPN